MSYLFSYQCIECGALMVRTPSGAVCSKGCGKIRRRKGGRCGVVDVLIGIGVDHLPCAHRKRVGRAAVYSLGDIPCRRVGSWPGTSIEKIKSLVRGGARPANYQGRIVVLQPAWPEEGKPC